MTDNKPFTPIPYVAPLNVEVLDMIMGSAKTTGMLEWMKNNPGEKYLFITPLLSEVESRVAVTEGLDIYFPVVNDEFATKGDSLLALLTDGVNIATTHSMYGQLRSEHLREIVSQGYIVICDEQIESISAIENIDYDNLKSGGYISIQENGQLKWIKEEVLLRYADFKRKCDRGVVFAVETESGCFIVVTQMPIRLITCAKRFIICTYRFQGSTLERFLTLKGANIKPFTDIPSSYFRKISKADIRKLITLVGSDVQLKNVRSKALSTTWWRMASEDEVKDISKAVLAISKQHSIAKGQACWCVPKGNVTHKNVLKRARGVIFKIARHPSGIDQPDYEWIDDESIGSDTKVKRVRSEQEIADECSYLPCNAIATNLYANRKAMFHLQNRYMHVTVKSYFSAMGVQVDEDSFALSEMLQWLWRGCIRQGQPMLVCIGSPRMLKLLTDWLAED